MTLQSRISPVRGRLRQRRTFADFALLETIHGRGSRLERHRHGSAFFTVVIRGRYYESCRGSETLCVANTVRYLPAGELHRNHFPTGAVCLNIQLFPHFCSRIDRLLNGCGPGEIQHLIARSLGRRLWSDFNVNDNLTEFAGLSVIFDLTGLLRQKRYKADSWPAPWLQRVKEYLDAHYTLPLRASELVKIAERHPVHLSREFRRFYGRTLVQFVRERRVLRGAEMLRSAGTSIADVSLHCGFYDQSHFTNVFRQVLGCTPAHYRDRFPSR